MFNTVLFKIPAVSMLSGSAYNDWYDNPECAETGTLPRSL